MKPYVCRIKDKQFFITPRGRSPSDAAKAAAKQYWKEKHELGAVVVEVKTPREVTEVFSCKPQWILRVITEQKG